MKFTRSMQRSKIVWVNVDPNTNCWRVKSAEPPNTGARLAKIKCTATILYVFSSVLPAVLVETQKELEEESL